jgi:UDP-3-O-[3-hydroxymyristoyl] glucosamine N-acyltransferase
MRLTVLELSNILQGELKKDSETLITHPAKIEEAGEGSVTFIANQKYMPFAYSTGASAIIVNHDIQFNQPVKPALIRVEDPYSAFTQVLEIFSKTPVEEGSSPFAFIAPTAKLESEVFVGPLAYVGERVKIGEGTQVYPQVYLGNDVEIGAHTILYPGVKIYHGCKIGDHCIVHAGAVIGSDGFGFAPQPNGEYKKVPQTGIVVIEDGVEIGSNCSIDRATVGATLIKTGAKIDNLVQLAHNVVIGSHTVVAAQAGISGSTQLGAYCMVGGQAGFVGHLRIADQVKVNAQSGVTKSVSQKGAKLTGSPADDYTKMLRAQAVMKRLPELEKRIEELEKNLKDYNPEK